MLRMIRRIGPTALPASSASSTAVPSLVGTRIEGVPVLGGCEQAQPARRSSIAVRQILVVQGELLRPATPPTHRRRPPRRLRGPRGAQLSAIDRRERRPSSPGRSPSKTCCSASRCNWTSRTSGQWIDGRVILVTGSAGSIGSEICRQLLQFAPQRIVLVDRAETGQFFLERELRPLAGRKQHRRLHRRRARRAPHAPRLDAVPAARDLPCRRLQARSPDGTASAGSGAEHRDGHPATGRPGHGFPHRLVRDDLDRQGGQSHQRDGGLQAGRRTVRPVAGRPLCDPLRHRALRQRPGFGRQRGATVPPADRRRRSGDGHRSRRCADSS